MSDQEPTYRFTASEFYAALSGFLELYLEYRDVHGYDVRAAARAAAGEALDAFEPTTSGVCATCTAYEPGDWTRSPRCGKYRGLWLARVGPEFGCNQWEKKDEQGNSPEVALAK